MIKTFEELKRKFNEKRKKKFFAKFHFTDKNGDESYSNFIVQIHLLRRSQGHATSATDTD